MRGGGRGPVGVKCCAANSSLPPRRRAAILTRRVKTVGETPPAEVTRSATPLAHRIHPESSWACPCTGFGFLSHVATSSVIRSGLCRVSEMCVLSVQCVWPRSVLKCGVPRGRAGPPPAVAPPPPASGDQTLEISGGVCSLRATAEGDRAHADAVAETREPRGVSPLVSLVSAPPRRPARRAWPLGYCVLALAPAPAFPGFPLSGHHNKGRVRYDSLRHAPSVSHTACCMGQCGRGDGM